LISSLPTYLGNTELLEKRKVGFLASRKISTLSVLPTLDWATGISKDEDVAVVSGYHSMMERNVLKCLLNGRCGIIIVLARGMYKKLPKEYVEIMSSNRLLIISYEKESVTRVSETTAHKRNDYVREIADEMKVIPLNSLSE
jgi:predicted Rossmann fold nucleotide-binding protein DprA/Smf involved in DNA uptake